MSESDPKLMSCFFFALPNWYLATFSAGLGSFYLCMQLWTHLSLVALVLGLAEDIQFYTS